jgi:hypothetical protein
LQQIMRTVNNLAKITEHYNHHLNPIWVHCKLFYQNKLGLFFFGYVYS